MAPQGSDQTTTHFQQLQTTVKDIQLPGGSEIQIEVQEMGMTRMTPTQSDWIAKMDSDET